MKQRLTVILCLLGMFTMQKINAQCPGSLTCDGAGVLCEIDALNGFTCNNPSFPNATFPLGSLCFGQGAPHNLNWWAFVGAGGPLTLNFGLSLANCQSGQGIQAGVFEGNCAGTNVWDCDAACNTTTFSLSGLTIPCEIYYVWVDGCNGDVCTYELTVSGNGSRPNLPSPLPPPSVDPVQPCLCGTAEVCAPNLPGDCEPTESWTVDGVPAGANGDDCITVDFPTMAPRTVCLTLTIGNPDNPATICDQEFTCITVSPRPPEQRIGNLRQVCAKNTPFMWHGQVITTDCISPPCSARIQLPNGCCVDSLVPIQLLPPEQRIGPLRIICPEDQPYNWHGQVIATSCINPPCTARVEGPDECLIDSIVPFRLLPPRRMGMVDTFFCAAPPLGPAYRDQNTNRVYSEDQCMEMITFKDPVFGCDTSYFLNLRYFKYAHDWEVDCGPCAGAVTLCPNIEYDPDCPEFNDQSVTITLEWIGPDGNVIGITPGDGCQNVTKPGEYFVYLTVSYRGRECPSAFFESIELDSSFFPPKPTIDGDTSVCASVPGEYFFENPPSNVCEFNWTIKRGGGRIITPGSLDSSRIQVDWTNSTGNVGEVCLSYKTDCGVTEDTCFLVDFSGTPQINAGPDTNICASSYTMLGIPDVPGGSWTQVEGPEQAMLVDVFDPNTDVSINTFGVYRFIWTESENGCDAIDTVTIGFRPDPQVGTVDTLCGGDATDFVVEFDILTGQGPFVIVSGGGSINGNQYTSDTIPDNTPTTIIIQDSFGCELTYFIDYDCECPNEIGTVSSDTLAFCGNSDQACIDYNSFGQILDPGVDTLMFVLYTTPGDVQGSEVARSTDGCFSFDAMTMNLDQVYYLAAVIGKNDGNNFVDYSGGCLKIAEGQPVIWHEQPTPDAGADDSVCGQLTSLTGLTSVAGSSYRWQNTAGISIDDPSDLNTSLTLQGTFGTYQLILEETNATCTSTDTVEITFFEIPESVNAREICIDSINRVNYDYIVCFNIVRGQPPYTIVQGGGSIDPMTNRYCSDQLMSLQVYDIIIEDANGCQFQLTGDHNCDCGMSDPGTMDQATLESCVNECVTVASNGSEILQQDEIAEFILHEGSGGIIVNELARIQYDHTANPAEQVQFCFDAAQGMIPGRVYYISRLIRSATEPDDPCERLAPGTPVIWNSYPTSDAGMDQDVCGLTADLNALPSIGNGSWSITAQPAGSNVIYATDLSTQMITVDQYGTYTFQWKEDNFGCADSAAVAITFHDAPRVANFFFECDDVAENYRLWIEVADGDAATYDITGTPMQQQSANTFRTDWIATGASISFCATDQWDCNPFCVDTSYVCECITEPGTLAGDDIMCIDECVRVSYNGGMRDANDVLAYILHDGDAVTIGTQIECNTNGRFCFDAATMTANQTYYITAVAGNSDGSGCVDLAERCAVQSQGVPITWFDYPAPDANASSNTFTCQTDSIEITGANGNGLPGALNYTWEVISGSLCSSSNSTDQNIWICASGTYVLTIEHAESGCSSTDTVVIARDADLPAVNAGNNNEITCDQPTIILDATGSDFGGSFLLEWIDPMGSVISNDLTVQVSTPGTYTVRVTNGMNDCSDEATVTITENTTPPTAIIDQLGQLSCQVKTIDIEATSSVTQGGVRTYSWSTTNGQINGAADQGRINITSPGDYQVIIVDEINGCRDTNVATVIEIGNTLESMDVDAMDPTCFGRTDGILDVDIVGGVPPLEYSLNGGPFGTNDVFTGLGPGTYDILVRDMNGCEKDTTVTIVEPAEIGITAKDDLIKEAGSSVDLDTLVESVQGIQRQEADREWWINTNTGDTLNRLVIDSLTETVTYRVVIDKNGCFADDLITIFVKYTRKVFVPNVIITNGQSGNPENGILSVHANDNRIGQVNFMRVYDRWGELVYSMDNIQYDEDLNRTTEGWDGTFNGELVNPGVYVYHIEVSFLSADGNPFIEQFFGDVTVLR